MLDSYRFDAQFLANQSVTRQILLTAASLLAADASALWGLKVLELAQCLINNAAIRGRKLRGNL